MQIFHEEIDEISSGKRQISLHLKCHTKVGSQQGRACVARFSALTFDWCIEQC